MKRNGKLTAEELSMICEQLAMILRAGLPMHDGVEALCENEHGTRYESHFATLNTTVLETGSLYEGLKAAAIFPDYMMEMARIGERTGELDNVMAELSLYYEREARNRHAIHNAVVYPLLLIGMMAILIAVLLLQVFPIFEDVFRGLGVKTASSLWMALGISVSRGALIVAGALIVLVLAALALLKSDTTGKVRRVLFHVLRPLARLERELFAGRFAATVAMMLRSGYPLDESLTLIESLFDDPTVRVKVKQCRTMMDEGAAFPDAVEKIGLFDKLHCRMLSVGFRSGQTDRVLGKLAQVYQEQSEDQISHLVSVIEPSLVALMSVIIGAILLSVMLPLLSIMNGMA